MNFLGNSGVGKIAGQKAGEAVEYGVNTILAKTGGKKGAAGGQAGGQAGGAAGGGQKPKEGEKKEGGGFDIGDVLSFGGEKKKEGGEGGEGGFDIGDVLSFGGEKKEGDNKGAAVENLVGGLFK